MRLAIPPAFRLPPGRETRLAWVESEAVSSLLAHKADAEQIGVIEVMVETAIRALNLAPKRPKHCAHLEPAMLEEGLRIMHRAGYAIDHAKTRQKATGIYGLDAADRKAITDFADWHAALNAKGAIPRAIWIQALGLCVKGSGVKLKPLDELEAA
jgi:hypothetical protein